MFVCLSLARYRHINMNVFILRCLDNVLYVDGTVDGRRAGLGQFPGSSPEHRMIVLIVRRISSNYMTFQSRNLAILISMTVRPSLTKRCNYIQHTINRIWNGLCSLSK